MSVTGIRRTLGRAVLLLCALMVSCGPVEDTDVQEERHDEVQEERHDQVQEEILDYYGRNREYLEWARSLGPDNSPGFPCGPPGGGLPSNVPPPHFIAWSPDGRTILFDDVTLVQLVDVDGTRLRELVDSNPGYHYGTDYAEFSPDGRRIVYASCEYPTDGLTVRRDAPWTPRGEYHWEIATVAIDGSGGQRLTTNEVGDYVPTWSPDGRRIAFLSGDRKYHATRLQLRTLAHQDSDSEPESTLTNEAHLTGIPPQWSPDGARLAVQFLGRLDVVEADGSGQVTVTSDVMTGVSWSPDGRRLAFARRHGQAAQLVTIAADGSDERVVRSIGDLRGLAIDDTTLSHVAWSPDGSLLLYVCGYQLCVVNLDGEIVGRSPAEFAKERGKAAAAWAPDGSRIAVRAAGNPTPNGAVVLYTMAPDGTDVRVLVRGGLGMVAEHSGYQDAEASKTACREGYVVPDPTRNPGLVADCETLMAMRDTLAGQTLLNWSAGTPLDQWAGIQISGEPRRVTGLTLGMRPGIHGHESHRLTFGRLAPEIGNLDQLQTLDLCCHKLLGTFPPELEGLQHLRELNLRLHGGARLDGCLSAGFVEQLEVAEGLRICGQERSR